MTPEFYAASHLCEKLFCFTTSIIDSLPPRCIFYVDQKSYLTIKSYWDKILPSYIEKKYKILDIKNSRIKDDFLILEIRSNNMDHLECNSDAYIYGILSYGF